jgi:hypothetical protein
LQSLAERGHPQEIAGYYDGDNLDNLRKWNKAVNGVPRVTGFLYTTWQRKYDQLEAYGAAIGGKK